MEKIYRKINVYKSRSHQQGLLPFIRFNEYVESESGDPFYYATSADTDGNFGGYVANPIISGEVVNYVNYITHYNQLMNMMRNGTKMKHVIKNSGDTWTPYSEDKVDIFDYKVVDSGKIYAITQGRYYSVDGLDYTDEYEYINCIKDYSRFVELSKLFGGVDNVYEMIKYIEEHFIGKLNVDKDIEGDLVPVYFYYCDIEEWLDWFEKHKYNDDCCIKELWKRKGGDKMYAFLKKNKDLYQEKLDEAASYVDIDESIPYINVLLPLNNNFNNLGIYLGYQDEDEDYCLDQSLIPYTDYEISGWTANSRLKELASTIKYQDDYGIDMPGLFLEPIEKTFYRYENGEWVVQEGASYSSGYTTYTCETSLPISADDGTIATVRYLNSEDYPMVIPYDVFLSTETYTPTNIHYVLNADGNKVVIQSGDTDVYLMTGDFIKQISINDSEDEIYFKYVIGGIWHAEVIDIESASTSSSTVNLVDGNNNGLNYFKSIDYINETGIEYEETYNYYPSYEGSFRIDGKDDVTIYYNKIDFESSAIKIKNDDLGLERTGNISNIIGFEKNSIWKEQDYLPSSSGNCKATNTPVYKHESLMGFDDEVTIDVDFTLDRGSAAAFEKHLKLSECNSLQDLENYSNNIFNL